MANTINSSKGNLNLPKVRDDSEKISEVAIAGFRVFIANKEVTEDVQSLRIQLHDGGNSSMAQVTLNNELDKYVITPNEMALLSGIDLSDSAISQIKGNARTLAELSAEQSEEDFDPEGLFGDLRISSSYGARVDPITGRQEFHKGVDYASPRTKDPNTPDRNITGEPIISPFEGEVVKSDFEPGTPKGAGHYVVIKTPDNHLVRIFHLNKASPLKAGDKVKAGETNLGEVGSSGGSTGPHVHIEMREIARTNPDGSPVVGKSIDPRAWRPPGGVTGNKTIAPSDEVEIDGYKRTGTTNALTVDSLNDLIEGDLPRLAAQEAAGDFSRLFEGSIYDVKRELMLDKFFRGRFIRGGSNYFFPEDLEKKKEEPEGKKSSRNTQGPFPKLTGWVPEYQIYSGSTCFHSQDTVRIFLQDPYDPYVWYYGFSGYLTDDSDVIDVNGNKTVEFTFEDVTRPFKYSRIAINPQISNPEALASINDTIIYAGFKEGFSQLSVPESLFFQVFGGEPLYISNEDLNLSAKEPTVSSAGVEGPRARKIEYIQGVGNFDLLNSSIFILGKEENVALAPANPDDLKKGERKFYQMIEQFVIRDFNLQQYQSAVDHRVKYEDLKLVREDGDSDFTELRRYWYQDIINQVERDKQSGILNLTIEDSPIWNTMTYIGENEDVYPVSGRLIMLFPGSLNPTTNTKVLVEDVASYSFNQSNFQTRFSIMKLYADRLDFSFYASPRGDLIFEMPLYDFHPDDFGLDETIPAGANRGIYTQIENNGRGWPEYIGTQSSRDVYELDAKDFSGPSYAHAFTIAKNHQIGTYSRSFSDAAIRTLVTTGYYNIQGFLVGGESRGALGTNIGEVAEALIPSFGIRHEIVNPHAYISTPEAAKLYAGIQLNKMNSAAMQIRVDIDAKFDLFLNRPIRIQEREILGTLRSVTHEIDVGGRSISTSNIQLDNTRIWTGGINKKVKSVGGEYRKIFEPIGTEAAKSIDYGTLFKRPGDEDESGENKAPTARKNLTRTGQTLRIRPPPANAPDNAPTNEELGITEDQG